jgi:putative type-1 restriction enzyme mjaXP specificity protein
MFVSMLNDNLHQQLKVLYDYWFTQFDYPDSSGKPYKLSGGTMVSSDKVSYKIPAGWKVETLLKNSLSNILKPGVEYFTSKTYLATADVNGTDISSGSVIEYETREKRANMQPTLNSVWFAKMKNSKKHLYLNKEMKQLVDECILSTGFCGLQCTEESFEYISSFIEHSYFELQKNTLAHGATQEAVNNDDLSNVAIVIPSSEVLNLFHQRTSGIYSQISKNICENQELTKLRDWLLPMLMNGQATISD